MEYTVKKLAELAGISTRTLRYYDEIDILKPARINSSGYRIYGETQIDKLQQIMFYRELGVGLDSIKTILCSSSFNKHDALREHHGKLLDKKQQLELLIANVEKTIAMTEGRTYMSDKEKFEGFKKKMIEENELKYGKEVREKYGNGTIDSFNQKIKNMSEEQYDLIQKLTDDLNEAIKSAYEEGDPSSQLAQKACELHKMWLLNYWDQYSKEAHMGLVQMYVDDERFTAYYDKIAPGCTVFLRNAMRIFTGVEE
ncbi:MerR family transcriptional regulator [Alkalibaculum sp. M08DMB]|uniref:MerR family transcriptional regulator n=1 Tax=Alkalibaculum sporogenes TaxID=2655001 RepID=A0A6A7KCT2_9FIRM|nr:MerR family transcriptional regulator [Alkalibaculum sporogenes]MPW27330.1 MerR family transcriptional regulator [Alkalibaculum sporogenes]